MVAFGESLAIHVAQMDPALGRLFGKEFASVAVALMHTAVMFPEWAKAIVEDSTYFSESMEGVDETYEEVTAFITKLWPGRWGEEVKEEWPPKSNKTEEMQMLLSSISGNEGNIFSFANCALCERTNLKPEDFRNMTSRAEFGISRMCQACQDSTFGVGE